MDLRLTVQCCRTLPWPVKIMHHRNVARQHSAVELACYGLGRTLIGCRDPVLGGPEHPQCRRVYFFFLKKISMVIVVTSLVEECVD